MKLVVIICSSIFAISAFASGGYSNKQAYIEDWYRTAINQMISHKIPASITLAQGILESNFGNSDLAKIANNHFGIKCATWNGEKFYKDDDKKDECFRKYNSANESYEDHSLFLTKARYSFLFDYKITDYKKWANGLKTAGYATNPKYPQLLINLIEDLELYKYDQMGLVSPGGNIANTKLPKTKDTDKGADIVLKENTSSTSVSGKIAKSNSKISKTKKQLIFSIFDRTDRKVFTQPNRTKYIIAQKGDTYVKIAKEFELTLNQLYGYNDNPKGKDILNEGDFVYLQPKAGFLAKEKQIKLDSDMTIAEISQKYGVKASRIMRKNNYHSADDLVGKNQKIKL